MTDRIDGTLGRGRAREDAGARRRRVGGAAEPGVADVRGSLRPDPRAVLIVEDDEGLSALIARHLRARGHDVRVAGSAREAAGILDGGFAPSAIVLDIDLPGESGWSLLRDDALVRAGSPAIVVASATEIRRSRLRASAVAHFLPKPFALASLVDAVEGSARSGLGRRPEEGPNGADPRPSRPRLMRPPVGAPEGTDRPGPGSGSTRP